MILSFVVKKFFAGSGHPLGINAMGTEIPLKFLVGCVFFHLSHSTVLGGAEKIEINIYGTNSTLRISEDPSSKILQSHNTSKLKMEILNKNSNKWKELKPKKSQIGKWRVEEEFINAIKGKEKISHTTFSDGVKYMQFADALKISSESNKKVYLPLTKWM